MIPLYTIEEFEQSKTNTLLPLQCKFCKNTYYRTRHRIVAHYLNPNSKKMGNFCSSICRTEYSKEFNNIKVECLNCNIIFSKKLSEFKKHPNSFCSNSCSASYNNRNKKHGTRRSKLEIWIEKQLYGLYPDLEIVYNQKTTIKSELDIYIPSLNLAFELNGIFHYEPIYGINKLEKIKENDLSKSKQCHDAKIDLCIIDTSQQSYTIPKTSQKYLDIIIRIINDRVGMTGLEPV